MALPIPDSYEIRDAVVATEGEIEFRAAATDDERPGFDGYITTWWTVDDRGTFFVPGSAKKTLKDRVKTAPVLQNHDYYSGLPIGRHLSADEDDKGVRISTAISETTLGMDALRLLRDKVPIGLSFGFDRLADRTATDKDPVDLSVAPDYIKSLPRNELRAITEWRWWESSLVTFPANAKAKPDTIRSLDPNVLTTLLDDLKAGTLDAEQRALIDQIVAAEQARAADGQNHGTPDPDARRVIAVEHEYLTLFGGLAL